MATTKKQTSATSKAKEKRKGATQVAKLPVGVVPVTRSERESFMSLIGLEAGNTLEVIHHVEKGLRFSAVERLRQEMNLPTKTMAELLQVKLRTFLRRKEEGRLHPDESDRVVRASRLFARALDLFDGDTQSARDWLLSPQRALGGAVPLEVARTEVGAREVEQIIGRLEHGVFT